MTAASPRVETPAAVLVRGGHLHRAVSEVSGRDVDVVRDSAGILYLERHHG